MHRSAVAGERKPTTGTKKVLTPAGLDETLVLLESVVWQAAPFPKITRIMTPRNSAAGSLTYSLIVRTVRW